MEPNSANTHAPTKAAEMANFILLIVLALVLSVHSAPSVVKQSDTSLGLE